MKFKKLAETFHEIEEKSSKLEMTHIIEELFKEAKKDEIDLISYLLLGKLLPNFKGIVIGMGEKFVEMAIAKATGYTRKKVEEAYRETGDLGDVAFKLMENKKQAALFNKELTVKNVYESFYKIATSSGKGSQDTKIKILTELLNNATPTEAKYIARFPTEKMRLGVAAPTILDALSFMKTGSKEMRPLLDEKYNVHPDIGLITKTVKEKGEKGLNKIKMQIGIPIIPELCERLPTSEEILEKHNGKSAIEAKYDGFRIQGHKNGNKVTLFTRRLDNVTETYPDIVEAIQKQVKAKKCILDAEALAFNEETNEFYPFQRTMQRKRKHGIQEAIEKYPLRLFVFDILNYNGKNILDWKHKDKRKLLRKIIKKGKVLSLSEEKIVTKAKDLTLFFDDAVARGLEGIIAKDLESPYRAGTRGYAWIKLKRDYQSILGDTVDLVIVGAYKGHGGRAKFGYTSFLCAVYDQKEDEFLTVSKVSTGLTEEGYENINKELKGLLTKKKPARLKSTLEPDTWVKPEIVLEVKATELTRSTMHTAKQKKDKKGYALRFPRIKKIRDDKEPEDATTLKEIVQLFKNQKQIKLMELRR